jgi:hypothetical protein
MGRGPAGSSGRAPFSLVYDLAAFGHRGCRPLDWRDEVGGCPVCGPRRPVRLRSGWSCRARTPCVRAARSVRAPAPRPSRRPRAGRRGRPRIPSATAGGTRSGLRRCRPGLRRPRRLPDPPRESGELRVRARPPAGRRRWARLASKLAAGGPADSHDVPASPPSSAGRTRDALRPHWPRRPDYFRHRSGCVGSWRRLGASRPQSCNRRNLSSC